MSYFKITAENKVQAGAVLDLIHERIKQDVKWGIQNWTDPEWALILGEEYGELQKEILESMRTGKIENIRGELVQVGAVVVAWLECIERERQRKDRVREMHSFHGGMK